MFESVQALIEEHRRVQEELSDPAVHADAARAKRVNRRYAELNRIVAAHEAWTTAADDLQAARELAEDEIQRLRAALPDLEQALRLALLPRDAADARPAIIEIRPGTGGDEAALFAGDLLRMYQRYAEAQGWSFQLLELAESELGGVREAMARIEGEGVFARLKYESGVHRVQRVPATEASGRIHTSAATVAARVASAPVKTATSATANSVPAPTTRSPPTSVTSSSPSPG